MECSLSVLSWLQFEPLRTVKWTDLAQRSQATRKLARMVRRARSEAMPTAVQTAGSSRGADRAEAARWHWQRRRKKRAVVAQRDSWKFRAGAWRVLLRLT